MLYGKKFTLILSLSIATTSMQAMQKEYQESSVPSLTNLCIMRLVKIVTDKESDDFDERIFEDDELFTYLVPCEEIRKKICNIFYAPVEKNLKTICNKLSASPYHNPTIGDPVFFAKFVQGTDIVHTLQSETESKSTIDCTSNKDGSTIASIFNKNRLAIVSKKFPIKPLIGSLNFNPTCIQFDPNGNRLYLAGSQGEIRICKVAIENETYSAQTIFPMNVSKKRITTMIADEGYIAFADEDREIVILKNDETRLLKILKNPKEISMEDKKSLITKKHSGHAQKITSLVFWTKEKNKALISGSEDGTIKILPFTRENSCRTLEGNHGKIQRLALYNDLLASYHPDKKIITLWYLNTKHHSLVKEISVGDSPLFDIGFNEEGTLLAINPTETLKWPVSSAVYITCKLLSKNNASKTLAKFAAKLENPAEEKFDETDQALLEGLPRNEKGESYFSSDPSFFKS
jgi:WD40 repeat protein